MNHDDPRATSLHLIDRLTNFVLVNLLWMIGAALIITLPAATAGLFATLTPWARGTDSEPFKDFFGGVRRWWFKSAWIAVLDAALAALIIADLRLLDQMALPAPVEAVSRSVNLFVAVIALMTNLYLWPLLVSLDVPLRMLIKIALRLVFLHPAWSLIAVGLALVPLLLIWILPGFVVVIGLFSTCALIASWGAWRVLKQHERELFSP